jgi:hypothetical protein
MHEVVSEKNIRNSKVHIAIIKTLSINTGIFILSKLVDVWSDQKGCDVDSHSGKANSNKQIKLLLERLYKIDFFVERL